MTVLVDLLGRAVTDDRLRNSLVNHFAYVAGVHPDWFRPHQDLVVTERLEGFDVAFDDLCVLLDGAPDTCVEHLERRLHTRWSFKEAWALAAIGTEAALTAIAGLVRVGADRTEFEDCGIWTPSLGPAQRRFSPHRRVVERRPVASMDDALAVEHPVGLSLGEFIRHPERSAVVWHYLSLRLASVPGMPDWPAERVHLAGPKGSVGWVLAVMVDRDGCWYDERVTHDQPVEADEEDTVNNDDTGSVAAVELRPYDNGLLYANGHVLSTPNVFGVAGGPPLGLYPNPHCHSCDRLMFHIVTVQNYLREYGHGWRSLYLCEHCHRTTCTATNWN